MRLHLLWVLAMNRDSKVMRKILKRVRRMTYWQRIILMDWLNAWYSDLKEQQRLEEE